MAAAANGVDYATLIALWPSLTPGTTAAKLAQVNAMTVTGSIPASFPVTGAMLFNAMNWTEFAALSASDQTIIMQTCHLAAQQPLTGGAGTTLGNMFVAKFSLAGPTIAAFSAMARGITQPWWQANGYHAPFNLVDLQMAGGLV